MSLPLIHGVSNSVHSLVTQIPTSYNPKKSSELSVVGKTRLSSWRQALVDILRDCARKRSLEATKSVHGFVLKSEFSESDLMVLLNHVAHAYTKCRGFSDARQVFEEMTHRNVFSYTVTIFGSTENGLFLDGLELFREMLGLGVLPDKFSYSAILQACVGLGYVEFGKMVHAQTVKNGASSQIFVAVALLSMYAKVGLIEDSYRVFNNIVEPNEASWNAMISMYTSNGLYQEAYDLFMKMQSDEVSPDIYTIISVSKAIVKLCDIEKCREVHRCASELGLDSNVLVGTALIDMYSKCESFSDAKSFFDANFSHCKINSPWNALISGLTLSGQALEALNLFVKMRENNVRPDYYTYCSVFSAIASLKHVRFAKQVHGTVTKSGSTPEIGVSNAIADAYSKNNLIEEAKKVFEAMGERDIVSWTTMINAHSQASEHDEALVTFARMREEGFFPNEFTFSAILDSCASLSLLDFARQIHSLMCKSGQTLDNCTESALIDTYSKCGFISDARMIFEKISDPDTVSWTAIISGHAQHGLVKEALNLFEKMENSGETVNSITMLCVLFACSHGGLVEEGLNYFRRMEADYNLVPEMEHYACIVDLLGRSGHLSEAMEFIDEMPIEPNEMIWQTLLGACWVHGNLEMGEKAAEKILSIDPRYSSTYILLSNAYAESGSLEEGESLRHLMRNRGVRKEAGCSWISVKGKVNKFYAGDQSHPMRDLVYAKLMELRTAIESLDYVPDLSCE